MASKRRLRKNSCDGKIKYPTEQAALFVRLQTNRRHLLAYKCHFCHQWHLGTATKKGLQSVRDRLANSK